MPFQTLWRWSVLIVKSAGCGVIWYSRVWAWLWGMMSQPNCDGKTHLYCGSRPSMSWAEHKRGKQPSDQPASASASWLRTQEEQLPHIPVARPSVRDNITNIITKCEHEYTLLLWSGVVAPESNWGRNPHQIHLQFLSEFDLELWGIKLCFKFKLLCLKDLSKKNVSSL